MRDIMRSFVILIGVVVLARWAIAAEPAREDAQDIAVPDTAALLKEIRDLRADVLRLQQTVDSLVDGELVQLRAENERLRKEVHDLSGMSGQALPPVPMPDRALLEGLYAQKKGKNTKEEKPADDAAPTQEPAPSGDSPDTSNVVGDNPPDAAAQSEGKEEEHSQEQPAQAPAAPEPFKFAIVDQWGRTPDEVAADNRKSSSLKGIIGVVPPGSADEDLTSLARSLHDEYAAYDNVNIEVFDDIAAARAYKGKYVAPPKHRVLSISKHKASNRDVILLIRDEKAVSIPIAPPTASP